MNSKTRLAELRFLMGDVATMDRFTTLYQETLNDFEILGDKAGIRAIRELLHEQVILLSREWVKEQLTSNEAVAMRIPYPMGSLN